MMLRSDYTVESDSMDSSMNSLPSAPCSDVAPNREWLVLFEEERISLRVFVKSRLSGQGDHAVEDILQEVAIAVQKAEGLDSLSGGGFGAWLRRVASYKISDYWRGSARRNELVENALKARSADDEMMDSPYEWVSRIEKSQLITNVLIQLPERHRKILEQKYIYNLGYREISELENLSIKSVEYRLHSARELLRQKLQIAQQEEDI